VSVLGAQKLAGTDSLDVVVIRNLDGLSARLAMCDHALHGFVSLLNCTGKTKFLLHPSVQFFSLHEGP
jgi:hypothetical protein